MDCNFKGNRRERKGGKFRVQGENKRKSLAFGVSKQVVEYSERERERKGLPIIQPGRRRSSFTSMYERVGRGRASGTQKKRYLLRNPQSQAGR